MGRSIATIAFDRDFRHPFIDAVEHCRYMPVTEGRQIVEQYRRAWDNTTMEELTHERIRAAIANVPSGRVASYGDIAALAGAPTPRIVGWVLREDGGDLPWHRIVRNDGTVAKPEQFALLRAEGVLTKRSRIDMERFRWDPDFEA